MAAKQQAATEVEGEADHWQYADLPNLTALQAQLQFPADATEHPQATTNEEEKVAADKPLYYSVCTINEKTEKVFATEAETLEGGQQWDLNPLVFYRLKKPVASVEQLPLIDLDKLFKRSDSEKGDQSITFTVMEKDISQAELDKAQITDPETIELL